MLFYILSLSRLGASAEARHAILYLITPWQYPPRLGMLITPWQYPLRLGMVFYILEAQVEQTETYRRAGVRGTLWTC